LSFIIFFLISFERVNALSVIGTTTTTPFYPNQRAICKDASGNLHVVWRYNSTAIYYARSSDGGNTWSVNTSFYGATSTATSTKYYPSISCDGNNITVVYDDGTAYDLIIGISTDNGQTWSWKVVEDGFKASAALYSMPGNYYTPVVERRGQRIYIVYDWKYADGYTPYLECHFINSTDGGNTFGSVVYLDSNSDSCRAKLSS
jgi:predicted cupin superfamily sugar epimerase